MAETTNDEKLQNGGSDKGGFPNKVFICSWLSNFWNSFVDTVVSSVFLIFGSWLVLACLENLPNLNHDVSKIFNEAIGEVTLLVVPFLFSIASGFYLLISLTKWDWGKERLFNLMSGLQSLIVSIVGLMTGKMLYVTGKFPHPSVLAIGLISIVLVALFSTIAKEFKAGEVKAIGGFTVFTAVTFLILIYKAV